MKRRKDVAVAPTPCGRATLRADGRSPSWVPLSVGLLASGLWLGIFLDRIFSKLRACPRIPRKVTVAPHGAPQKSGCLPLFSVLVKLLHHHLLRRAPSRPPIMTNNATGTVTSDAVIGLQHLGPGFAIANDLPSSYDDVKGETEHVDGDLKSAPGSGAPDFMDPHADPFADLTIWQTWRKFWKTFLIATMISVGAMFDSYALSSECPSPAPRDLRAGAQSRGQPSFRSGTPA